METFGEHIRHLRERLDLSLRELARQVGVSAAFLSDVELGRRYPKDEVLKKIAQKLKASVDELKALDPRPPLADLRRLAASDPAYGLAFRRVIDQKVSPEELINLAKSVERRKKK